MRLRASPMFAAWLVAGSCFAASPRAGEMAPDPAKLDHAGLATTDAAAATAATTKS